MKVRSVFLLLGIAFGNAFSAAAEPAASEDILIIPRKYYLGDLITVQVELPSPAEDDRENPSPVNEDRWIEIESINTIEKSGRMYLFLQVRSFFPGERMLPPIRYGGDVITGITLSPQSYIDEEEYPFYSIRDSLLLPNTRWFILLSLCVCAAGLTSAVILGKRVKGVYGALKQKLTDLFESGEMLVTIRYLRKNYRDLAPREVYKILCSLVKKRIEREFSIGISHMTTVEIAALVPRDHIIKELLSRGDFVRFGGRPVSIDQIAEDIKNLEALARTLHGLKGEPGGRTAEC